MFGAALGDQHDADPARPAMSSSSVLHSVSCIILYIVLYSVSYSSSSVPLLYDCSLPKLYMSMFLPFTLSSMYFVIKLRAEIYSV